MFKRGSFSGFKLTLLIAISVVLMLMDRRSAYFQEVQNKVSVITTPFFYIVNSPVEFLQQISSNFVTQQQVLEDNARLRAQQLLLQAKLQRLEAIQSENEQLRALLQSSPHVGGRYTVAQLLSVSMDPLVQKVVLDKGSRENVYQGQPVLDAYGVMGQVITAGAYTSQVLLVTDPQSAISVQDSRNGVRAIAAGIGNNQLQLVNVPDSTDILPGDLMVTTGLDQRFPQGYPVGTVEKVQRDPELRFASISMTPSAHVDRSNIVLLVWPNLDALPAENTGSTAATSAASTAPATPAPSASTTTPSETNKVTKPSDAAKPDNEGVGGDG